MQVKETYTSHEYARDIARQHAGHVGSEDGVYVVTWNTLDGLHVADRFGKHEYNTCSDLFGRDTKQRIADELAYAFFGVPF